jgi:ABC-type multidrug transport system fused ATPase/permease subunit
MIDAMIRPISPGLVVSRIWELYQREAGTLLPVAAVLFAVQFLIAIILPTSFAVIAILVFWLLAILYQGFVVELVSAAQSNRRTDIGELLTAVTPVLGSLLVISVVFAVGVGIGFVLIIIPGLVLLTIWSVVVPVEVLEHRGILGSFERSRELVRGNGWNVFGVIVIVWVVSVAISFLVGLLAAPLGHVGRDLVQWAINVAITPIVALSATVLYLELRRAHAASARASDPAPATAQ